MAYAPDGATFVSAGADGKVVVYDGLTADPLRTLGAPAHEGSVYAVSYAPDSAAVVTAGADGYVRVWDVAEGTVRGEWNASTVAPTPLDAQQVGVVWMQATRVTSLSLGGVLYTLEWDAAAHTLNVALEAVGPLQPIAALVSLPGVLAAGSYDGRVYTYDADGAATAAPLASGSSSIVAMAAWDGDVVTVALDDALHHGKQYVAPLTRSTALTAQPRSVAVADGIAWVANENGVDRVEGAACQHFARAALACGTPTVVSASAGRVVIGTHESAVHVYDTAMTPIATLTNGRSAISALAISPDGQWLAAGESSGKILVYDLATHTLKTSHWVFHTARIAALAWSADSAYCASAGLDTHIYVWSVERPMKRAVYKNAHAGGATGVAWKDPETLASAGADGTVRTVRTPTDQFSVARP